IYTRRIKGAHEVDQVVRLRKEFYGRISSVIEQISDHLVFVGRAREEMKRIPSIDPNIPTLVVAGFPNVGKSQLVTSLSNARPTIASYPFTTKGIGVGHLRVRWFTYQVVDTPGLLDRPLEERNGIERQAVLALRYLADVIVFVLDPSETSGYTMEHQLSLLSSVESWMEGIPMVVVENKVDLYRSDSNRVKVSAFTGEGMEEMMEKVVPYLERGWNDSIQEA
ncbi:MAG: NOG1 family protein, partial [Methanomassiliicoccales archaeon]